MNARSLRKIGYPDELIPRAQQACRIAAQNGMDVEETLGNLWRNPEGFKGDFHGFAERIIEWKQNRQPPQKQQEEFLKKKDVTLLSAGLDEAPGAYKNIHNVMDQQSDLVEVVGRFRPWIVKITP